jgi:hypothetical protein
LVGIDAAGQNVITAATKSIVTATIALGSDATKPYIVYAKTNSLGVVTPVVRVFDPTLVLGVNNVALDANAIVAYTQNQNLKIQSDNLLLSEVKVYDLSGCLIAERKNIGANETSLSLKSSNAVYLLKVTTADGSVVTKKILQ